MRAKRGRKESLSLDRNLATKPRLDHVNHKPRSGPCARGASSNLARERPAAAVFSQGKRFVLGCLRSLAWLSLVNGHLLLRTLWPGGRQKELGSNPVLQGPWIPSRTHPTGLLPSSGTSQAAPLCTVTPGALVNHMLLRQVISRGPRIPKGTPKQGGMQENRALGQLPPL